MTKTITTTYQEVTVRKTSGTINERLTTRVKVYGSRSDAQDTASYLGRQGYLLLDIVEKTEDIFEDEIVTTKTVRDLEVGDVILDVVSLDRWTTAVVTELSSYGGRGTPTRIRVAFLSSLLDDGGDRHALDNGRTIVAAEYEIVVTGGTK